MATTDIYHYLDDDPDDLPELGERVIICVGDAFYGEGFLKPDGEGASKWYRYCDFAPLENYMSESVTAWAYFPQKRGKRRRKTKSP